jgi:hypothetical protein
MKTKKIVIALAATFFSCSLFAQNKNDTVPPMPPRTDTMPPNDTAIIDSGNVSLADRILKFENSLKNNQRFSDRATYNAFAVKEKEVSIF